MNTSGVDGGEAEIVAMYQILPATITNHFRKRQHDPPRVYNPGQRLSISLDLGHNEVLLPITNSRDDLLLPSFDNVGMCTNITNPCDLHSNVTSPSHFPVTVYISPAPLLVHALNHSLQYTNLANASYNSAIKKKVKRRRCGDFLRVYMNLERPEVNEHSRHDLEFCGSYSSIQNTVFSAGRSLILEFHSDYRTGKPGNYTGFKGVYQFLDKRNFQTTGTKVDDHQCNYDFNSNNSHHSGRFFSPFYPQHYRPNTSCKYRFYARPGERVKIIFSNVQLHHIDASCRDSPDVITVYDGLDESAPVIGQFCGVHNSEEVISTGANLVVTFVCDDHNQKQGFSANYEFINKYTSSKSIKSIKNES
ncbi:hypothetical protein Btru_016407, partial [Bulinus truncatus]